MRFYCVQLDYMFGIINKKGGSMVFYILGNGFSISFIQSLVQNKYLNDHLIDLNNLFSQGDSFSLDSQPNYLSSESCKALNRLGVSSRLTNSESVDTINNLVTSFNVYSSKIQQ